ncbi:MAG: transpeptidase family protein [Deltaproteobacteria bacterium]|nr:transpeptidase family protein [Deltaproteobacteria bacterium]
MKPKKKKPESSLKVRVTVVLGFFLVFFSAIFFRAFQLQVLDRDSLQHLAMKQHRKTINIQSKRGDIYDRNLKELAVSIEVDSVFAQSGKVENPREVSKALAPVLGMNMFELEKKLKTGTFVWLKRQVDLNEEQRKLVTSFEGVGIVKESRRFYPNRQLASNIIGFTGLDSNGLEGVERHYDNILKGSSVKIVGDKDAMGRMLLFEDLDKKVPVQSMVVELTIDKNIQYITEKALKKAVEDANAKGGTAIVMDPVTGEILAMASQPTFDPNDVKKFDASQWKNKSITDAFEPGSIFKLFLISAALEEGIVKIKDSIFCENGNYRVSDRVFHDHIGYGWLTVPLIMKYSSNIGSAKIGEKLGKAQLYRYVKAFGFGTKTGVDLPGEATGSFMHYSKWSNVTLHTVSFGQGVSATGVQLVTAMSAIANGGFIVKPYVVKSIKDSSGKVISESNPTIVRRIISEDTARKVTDMLIEVTKQGGTGTKAAIEGFDVAGKTGTAQKPDFKHGGYASGAYMASFMGYVPAKNPRLAILVSIDEPRGEYYGGLVSAPAFKEIAQESLSYLGVFPEKQDGMPKVQYIKNTIQPEPVNELEEAEVASPDPLRPMAIPDFTGKTVRAVLRMARERSFEVAVVGSGRAVSQKPAPGSSIPEKGPVVVTFQ